MSPLPGPGQLQQRFDRDVPKVGADFGLVAPLHLPDPVGPLLPPWDVPGLAAPVDPASHPAAGLAWLITYLDGRTSLVTGGVAYERRPGGAEGWREALEFRDADGAVVGRVSGDDVRSVRQVAIR